MESNYEGLNGVMAFSVITVKILAILRLTVNFFPLRLIEMLKIRVLFFGKIRKRICDPRSYGFFDTKETQNLKKDYFVMTRQTGGTQYICQNDISLALPKNSTRMEYK